MIVFQGLEHLDEERIYKAISDGVERAFSKKVPSAEPPKEKRTSSVQWRVCLKCKHKDHPENMKKGCPRCGQKFK